MAVESRSIPLGTLAPTFDLPDVTGGRQVRSADFDGQPLLVMFICRHCPYVKHVEVGLASLAKDYAGSDLALVAISANDANEYPEDAPGQLARQAHAAGFTFPYLYDEPQTTAQAYGAACTPEFFLFDRDRRLAYHGQLDGSRPSHEEPVTGRDLRAAIDAVLAGRAVEGRQIPTIGCGIKWKKGHG